MDVYYRNNFDVSSFGYSNNRINQTTMAQRVECEINQHTARALVENSGRTGIFAAIADCMETYGVDDILASAFTITGGWMGLPIENKSIKFKTEVYRFINKDGLWNPYFETGIRKKLIGDVPEEGHLYFINQNKYLRLIEAHAGLTFTAPDGIFLFGPGKLKKAFRGFADYPNKSHTEEFGEYFNPHYETKAIICLDDGMYIPSEGDIELFRKRIYN